MQGRCLFDTFLFLKVANTFERVFCPVKRGNRAGARLGMSLTTLGEVPRPVATTPGGGFKQ